MNTRRNFLKQAGILGAAVAASPGFVFAKPKYIPIGLQLYTVKDELPKGIEYVVEEVAKAGYNQLETFGYSKGSFFGKTPAEFSALLKKQKLTSPSGHYGIDNTLKTGAFEELDAAIGAAKILGQKYVTIPYIGDSLRKTAADIDKLVEKINEAAKHTHEAGLRMAYHSHSFEFEPVEGVVFYEKLLQGSDPKYLDLELDLYWAIRAGQDPIQWFERFPGRFTMVHVKDMDKEDRTLTTEVGAGSIDFRKIFDKAKLAGIKYYIVEQESFRKPALESITESATNLKKLLNDK